MAAPLALVLVVAVTVRAALFRSSLAEFISERVEVVSPLSSWKRGEAAEEVEGGPGPAAHLPLPARPGLGMRERRGLAAFASSTFGAQKRARPGLARRAGRLAEGGSGPGGPCPRGWGA